MGRAGHQRLARAGAGAWWRGKPARRTPLAASARPRPGRLARLGPPAGAGRWSLVAPLLEPAPSPTEAAHARALQLLERYGVLTREAALGEGIEGGFAGVYPVLKALEERGAVRRGYFVAGLGAAQFALARCRRPAAFVPRIPDEAATSAVVVLAATDPAQPFGARAAVARARRGRRPARTAGAHVVLVDGELAAYLERGGHSLVTFRRRRLGAPRCASWSTAAATDRSRSARSTASRARRGRVRRRPTSCGPPASSTATRASCTAAADSVADVPEGDTHPPHREPVAAGARRPAARAASTLHHATGGGRGRTPANGSTASRRSASTC